MTTPTESGVYSIGRSEYDALPDRVNFSTLKKMDENPATYLHALLNKDDDTDARLEGRAVHTRVYEPELFKSTYVVWEGRRSGPDWKAFLAKHVAEGHEVLTENMHADVIAVADAIRANAMAAPFLAGGAREQTVLWTLRRPTLAAVDGYEVKMKGRLDFVRPDSIVDLKTCRTAKPRLFGKQANDLHYLAQAALYVDGLAAATNTPPRPYWIIAAEKKAPHVVQVYRVTEKQLHLGRARYWKWLDELNVCRRNGVYPGYATAPMELTLPAYAMPDDEENFEQEAA